MIKKFKAIICFILIAVMLIPSLASCSTDKAPDGYKLVACDGDKFRLYVPKSWVANTDSGITSAYYSVEENAFVSVSIAEDRDGRKLSEYFDACKSKYEGQLTDYTFVSEDRKVSLGGMAAYQIIFTVTRKVTDKDNKTDVEAISGVKYKYLQMFSEFEGDIYVLTFSCPEEKFEAHKGTVLGAEGDDGDFSGIIPYFQFNSEAYSVDGKKISDKVVAPEGMKLISTDKRPYRFFVQKNWIMDTRSALSAAYYSAEDKSNVSLQAHMSTGEAPNLEDFFATTDIKYKNIYGDNYKLISKVDDAKMGEYNAIQFVFSVKSGDAEYILMQTVCAKGEMYYIFTYTSTPELFDTHMGDVEGMLAAFRIR